MSDAGDMWQRRKPNSAQQQEREKDRDNGKEPTINSDKLADLVFNISSMRREILAQFIDPRRDVAAECGHPQTLELNAEKYQDLYDRDPIAARVVELMPKESWQVTPSVYEDEDTENITPFEYAWDGLGKQLRGEHSYFQDEKGSAIWEYLRRADILSGIGQFGIILLGINDGLPLSMPANGRDTRDSTAPLEASSEGVPQGADAQYSNLYHAYGGLGQIGTEQEPVMPGEIGPQPGQAQLPNSSYTDDNGEPEQLRKLLFLRVFPESLVQITQYETDVRNPRYGQPVMYLVTLNDPRAGNTGVGLTTSTESVHWTRVIHIADNMTASEVFGVPRMRPVLNRLLDLQKLYGGSGEMYWRGAFPGLSIETHPQLGGDVEIDRAGLRSEIEQYQNGLQRALTLMGMSAKSLAPQVVDPTPQISIQIESICIQLACPVRVFKGSERGELASSQDDAKWNDRLAERENNYITPRIIVPFVDRLVWLGVLPAPTGYSVYWPDLNSLNDADRAAIAVQQTTALTQYVSGGVENLIQPLDYLVHILGLTEEVAKAILGAFNQDGTQEQTNDSTADDGQTFDNQPDDNSEPNTIQPPDDNSQPNTFGNQS